MWRSRVFLFLAGGLLILAGVSHDARTVLAQAQDVCERPPGGPVAPPRVTAQQVEAGTASLMDFALAVKERFAERAGLTDAVEALYLRCLLRAEGSPWRSGSTYIVILTLDGRVDVHAKDMSLSGRKLRSSIYSEILKGLGLDRADLVDPAAVQAALAGNGGSFNIPGASGYATVSVPSVVGTPNRVHVSGFDLDASHLAAEQIDYGDPTITARDVVDRKTLKEFVTQAGEYIVDLIKTDEPDALAKGKIALRDPNGPWRHGSVYIYIWNLNANTIVFHAAFPDRYDFRPLTPIARDAVTGEYVLPPLIEAAESGPEGGFVEYHFDDPSDDTDSADIPKVGYVRAFSFQRRLPDGRTVPGKIVVGSGFYQNSPEVIAARQNTIVEAVLPQVMRTMTASTVDAVSGRIERATSDTAPTAALSFGGASTLPDALLANAHALGNDTFDLYRLLVNSSFTLPLGERLHVAFAGRRMADGGHRRAACGRGWARRAAAFRGRWRACAGAEDGCVLRAE